MDSVNQAATIDRIRAWLIQTNPAVAGIDPGTDLIDSRILESLQLVEFILFLEDESGRSILAEDLDPASLRTLDTIYAHFFEAAP